MSITQVDDRKGYFQAKENNLVAGQLFYTWAGEDKFIIDHTEVNKGFEGKGIGKQLVMSAVQFAREKKVKILPLCPFAKALFDKTPEFQDVLF
jgi:predicted GNAT family acetyltransferase